MRNPTRQVKGKLIKLLVKQANKVICAWFCAVQQAFILFLFQHVHFLLGIVTLWLFLLSNISKYFIFYFNF